MSGDDEAKLLEAWRAGEKSAGEVLFERYYGPMLRFFSNKVAGDPDDLIQEVFMACVSGKDRIRADGSFRRYLFGVAYNRLRKHYARDRIDGDRFELSDKTAADLSPGAGTMIAKSAEQQLLLNALRRIPVEHQVVLEMFYWEGFTSATIADVLQEPHGTVRTRLRRARQLLEEALEVVATDAALVSATRSDLDGWAQKIREAAEAGGG